MKINMKSSRSKEKMGCDMSTLGLLIIWKPLKVSMFSLGVRKTSRDKDFLNYEIISRRISWETFA